MRYFLMDFLEKLERDIPPPAGKHHYIAFARYGNESEYEKKLALHVYTLETSHCLFLQEQDFEVSAEDLVSAVKAAIPNG